MRIIAVIVAHAHTTTPCFARVCMYESVCHKAQLNTASGQLCANRKHRTYRMQMQMQSAKCRNTHNERLTHTHNHITELMHTRSACISVSAQECRSRKKCHSRTQAKWGQSYYNLRRQRLPCLAATTCTVRSHFRC